jgi:hypothetical protein
MDAEVILSIDLGLAGDSISEQLNKQNFKYDDKRAATFQKDREAICRLRIMGYISDSICKKIDKKLLDKIARHVAEKNKLNIEISNGRK